jgi:hypothetical protein
MQNSDVFPNMVLQMVLDRRGIRLARLDAGQGGRFLRAEVDDAVDALSSLMEPMIMVVLGTLIGGMVIAMYLPIFKMGSGRLMELLASPNQPSFTGLVFLFGLMIGSFLNVVIHRLPKMMEAEWASQCAELRGEEPAGARRATTCGCRAQPALPAGTRSPRWKTSALLLAVAARALFGLRHADFATLPLVELFTALLSAVVAWKLGLGACKTLAALLLVWTLIALAFIDLDTHIAA